MNRRPLLVVRVALAALILAPAVVRAQVTGSIIGTVYDQNGMPLAGVKISARSPTQIGGTQTNASLPTKCDFLPGIGISMVKPWVGNAPPLSARALARISSSCLRLT